MSPELEAVLISAAVALAIVLHCTVTDVVRDCRHDIPPYTLRFERDGWGSKENGDWR